MFKSIKIFDNGYIDIRRQNGRKTEDKSVLELAKWFIEKYLIKIEKSIKVWTHGQNYTGEIGNADYLMDCLNLNWNAVQDKRGIGGLILRARRDGAMRLIKLIRENPDLIDYIKAADNDK